MHRENLQRQIARIRLGWLGHRLQEALPKKSAIAGRVRRSSGSIEYNVMPACCSVLVMPTIVLKKFRCCCGLTITLGFIENRPARSQPHHQLPARCVAQIVSQSRKCFQ